MAIGQAPGSVIGLVEWGPSGTRFDGRLLEGNVKSGADAATAVAREVQTALERRRMFHPHERLVRPRLGLWLDRRQSAAEAVTLLTDLSAKYDVSVLGITASTTKRELPAPALQRLETIRRTVDRAEKSRLLSEAVASSLAQCSGHERFFKSLDDGPDKRKRFHRAIISAAKACSCAGVDLDLIEAITVPELNLPVVKLRAVKVQERGQVAVALDPSATVQDLVDRLPSSSTFSVKWQKHK